MGWRRRPGEAPIFGLKRLLHPTGLSASLAHLDKRAGDVADHVLEEGGALNVKRDLLARSTGHRDDAKLANGMRRLAIRGAKGGEVVPPEQGARAGLHCR